MPRFEQSRATFPLCMESVVYPELEVCLVSEVVACRSYQVWSAFINRLSSLHEGVGSWLLLCKWAFPMVKFLDYRGRAQCNEVTMI